MTLTRLTFTLVFAFLFIGASAEESKPAVSEGKPAT